MGMFQAMLIRGDLANRGELICPEQQLSRGVGRVQVEDFFQLPFQEKDEVLHKGCIDERLL